MKRKISLLMVVLLILSIFSFSGCSESNGSKYKQALKLLGIESSKVLEDDVTVLKDLIESGNEEEIESALAILNELGDYKNSSHIVETVNQEIDNMNYDKAVDLFSEGNFDEAKAIFETFDEEFKYTKRYLSGIEYMSKIKGFWSAEYGDYDLNLVFVDITGPFSIENSSFSDCDWEVTANIEIEVSKMENEYQNFFIKQRAGFAHMTEDDYLVDTIYINHEKFDQQVFDTSRSGYSRICLTLEGDSLSLAEIVYNADWTKQYDYNTVTLEKLL